MGWTTIKNGELLNLAAQHFDVFVTVDGNLPFQQNLLPLSIAVVVLQAKTNRLADLRPLTSQLLVAIEFAAARRAEGDQSGLKPCASGSLQRKVAPMLEKFERYPLTFGPTPIEKLSRLSAHLGGHVELYAKREDCNSGLAFGGNKLRKLEYIIPDAIASNADTLVSIGGVQSNHTRHGRGGRGENRHEVPPGAGGLGSPRRRGL